MTYSVTRKSVLGAFYEKMGSGNPGLGSSSGVAASLVELENHEEQIVAFKALQNVEFCVFCFIKS